jgi:lysophospholipase L1-like esterase
MARRSPLAAALAVAAALLATPAIATAATGPYVALGDSYTAGPFVPNQVGRPIGCARSDRNYPSLVAAVMRVTAFRDESCSAATTEHMTRPQPVTLGVHSPQFEALHPAAELVTIGIGGNDVGLVGAAVICVQRGTLAPTGRACRSHFARPGGGDRLADRIAATAPRIAATLEGIHERSPQARVLIVGYPAVAARNGRSCYPLVPLSPDDMAYLDGMLRATNAMIAEQAALHDAEYVDTYDDSIGHDVCTPPGTRWFEGVVPTAPAFPVHPNALGMASMARSVLRVLAAPRPTPVLSDLRRLRERYTAGRAARFAYRLSRPATVEFTLRRALAGGRAGRRCAPPSRANRGARGCRRWSRALRVLRADGRRGENTVTLSGAALGRRPGLLRLTARPSSGPGQPPGASRHVQFRVAARGR